jgi:hypothetical protein
MDIVLRLEPRFRESGLDLHEQSIVAPPSEISRMQLLQRDIEQPGTSMPVEYELVTVAMWLAGDRPKQLWNTAYSKYRIVDRVLPRCCSCHPGSVHAECRIIEHLTVYSIWIDHGKTMLESFAFAQPSLGGLVSSCPLGVRSKPKDLGATRAYRVPSQGFGETGAESGTRKHGIGLFVFRGHDK